MWLPHDAAPPSRSTCHLHVQQQAPPSVVRAAGGQRGIQAWVAGPERHGHPNGLCVAQAKGLHEEPQSLRCGRVPDPTCLVSQALLVQPVPVGAKGGRDQS